MEHNRLRNLVKTSHLHYSEDDLFRHENFSAKTFPENTDKNHRLIARCFRGDAPVLQPSKKPHKLYLTFKKG